MAENADTVADYQSEEDVNLDGNNGGHTMPSPKRQRVQEPDDYVEEDGSDRELQQELDLELELNQGVVRENSDESEAENHEVRGDEADQEDQEGQEDQASRTGLELPAWLSRLPLDFLQMHCKGTTCGRPDELQI